MRGLRGQPVLDGDDGELQLLGVVKHPEHAAAAVVAEDHPAAVDEVDAADGGGDARRTADQQRDVGGARRARRVRGGDLERAAAPQFRVRGHRHRGPRLPHQRDVLQGKGGQSGRGHLVERGPQLGIERWRRPDLSSLGTFCRGDRRHRSLLHLCPPHIRPRG
jgi:hypothetical protein